MDKKINVDDLIAACNSLGQTDKNDGVYMKDRDCKSCIKEIVRELNNDDANNTIRSKLGEMNIIKSDLIPIINQYCDFNNGDMDLFSLILRLCTNMTASVLLLFENQDLSNDVESVKKYNKLIKGLYKYKEAFSCDYHIWETLNTHLRHTEDEVPFERLLILVRNILHIPVDSTIDLGFHNDSNPHTLCLRQMDKSGMLHTLIEIASETQRGTQFCFHIMEIIYLMLRERNPQTIASARANTQKRKLEDDDVDKQRLNELRAREKRSRTNLAAPRFRHSSFVASNIRSVSDAPQVVRHLTNSRVQTISFDEGKDSVKKNKNRKPFNSELSSVVLSDRDKRPSAVDYSLKLFCKRFTEKVYANYMQQIKHNLIQKKAAENDESYYLWAIQFFTSFNRHMHMSIDNVSETLSSSTLHFINVLINDYQEKLKIEKKRPKIERISRRLHLAIRAYREILALVKTITEDSEFHSTVSQIKKKIFSEVEYSNMLLSLFQQFDESKYCPEYMKDLISTTNVFLDIGRENQSMSAYYSCVDVLRAHCHLLKSFRDNDSTTNEHILDFIERSVNDNKTGIMLMQASLFKTLLEIVDDTQVVNHERFLRITERLSSDFVAMVADNKRWMFQELLFWKKHGDVIEIEHDPRQEQIITAEVVDDDGSVKAAEGEEKEKEANDGSISDGLEDELQEEPPSPSLVDSLSPLSQISGVDD